MYCPACGSQNNEDVRFCRKCGADLRVVSQALTKRMSWRKYIAAKIDDRMEAKRLKEDYSKGVVDIWHAVFLLFGFTYLVIFNYDRMVLFMMLVALSLLGFGIRDYWIHKRRLLHEYHPDPVEVKTQLGDLSIYNDEPAPSSEQMAASKPRIIHEAASTNLLPAVSPPSITEQTTKHLDRDVNQAKDTS